MSQKCVEWQDKSPTPWCIKIVNIKDETGKENLDLWGFRPDWFGHGPLNRTNNQYRRRAFNHSEQVITFKYVQETDMASAFIILPNQLFKTLPSTDFDQIVLLEDQRFFTDFHFHKKKLVFHRAGLKYYQSLLEKQGYEVLYLDHQSLKKSAGLGNCLKKNKLRQIALYDPVDCPLKDNLENEFKKAAVVFDFMDSPLYLCQESYLRNFFKNKKHYTMNSFYISQRKKFNIFVENGKPHGGKWSFDTENRCKLSKDIQAPELGRPESNRFVKDAKTYVEKYFVKNPGSTEDFFYPVTHLDAEHWLQDFLQHRLDSFGPYEDAISSNESFLFHSLLSPLLNSGLLTPQQVLQGVLEYSRRHKIRFNSTEGFVRQLIGWREFMRAVYVLEGSGQKTSNFWNFKHTIPQSFYDGSTGVEPVDTIIQRVTKNAYAHHIERLMILGNFMLLCEIHPKEVYRWFMELFIDAYEWVMVPNVFGMSQYADGGMITTKPYIGSSNYIRKMSDFKAGPWCDIWDSLFWRFIQKQKKVFAENPRMKIMAVCADRMQKEKMNGYIEKAENYLRALHKPRTY